MPNVPPSEIWFLFPKGVYRNKSRGRGGGKIWTVNSKHLASKTLSRYTYSPITFQVHTLYLLQTKLEGKSSKHFFYVLHSSVSDLKCSSSSFKWGGLPPLQILGELHFLPPPPVHVSSGTLFLGTPCFVGHPVEFDYNFPGTMLYQIRIEEINLIYICKIYLTATHCKL